MSKFLHPFVLFGVFSTGLSLAVAAIVWQQRTSRGARTYAALMILLAVWSFSYVVQLLQPTVAGKQSWFVVRNSLSPLVAILFWLFTAQYTDRRELLSLWYLGPILCIGTVMTALPILNPFDLFWSDMSLYTQGSFPRAQITFESLFWLFIAYIVGLVGGGHGYIVLDLMDSFAVYRRQLTAMVVVGALEFTFLFLFLSDHTAVIPSLNPWPHLQLITYNMAFVALPLGWSYFKASLFNLQPLTRQAVIENMDDAVFVFDENDRLRDSNAQARQLVSFDQPGSAEGRPAIAIFHDHPTLLEMYQAHREDTTPIAATIDHEKRLPEEIASLHDNETDGTLVQLSESDEGRYYDFRVSAIRNATDELVGTVVVARDLTIRHRQREMIEHKTAELERANERLEKFAGMASHDLRNPLNVILGHIDLIDSEGYKKEHLRSIERSATRMERMISDMLALARAGQNIDDLETVSLSRVAEDSWNNVRVDGTEFDLRVPENLTVEADRGRLMNVFENLFRNTGEHNEPPLTIHVGVIQSTAEDGQSESLDGFFIEDDGDGIPENERDEIFERGYTTSEDGTGFGLAIARDVIEAHEWSLSIRDGDSGGARFEVTDVEISN